MSGAERRSASGTGQVCGIVRVLKLGVFIVGVVAFGAASACLAVFGASSVIGDRPVVGGLLGAVVAIGLTAPPLVRRFADHARRRAISAQELLRWHADMVREEIVSSGVGLSLRDVGVHVFVKTRRNWPLWRYEYLRFARSAWSPRSPEPRHAVWSENWRTGMADGLVGLSAQHRTRLQVDLMDSEHQVATETIWDEWYASRDARSLGVRYTSSGSIKEWFSTMWAEPIPSPSGQVLGVITINVEREIPDGFSRLTAAGASRIVQASARSAGFALAEIQV
jgi:hypothetical protein